MLHSCKKINAWDINKPVVEEPGVTDNDNAKSIV